MDAIKKILLVVSFLLVCRVYADDIKTSFYNYLDNGEYMLAETALSEWENKDNGNPDLFLARFYLLLNKSYKFDKISDTKNVSSGDIFLIADSIGFSREDIELNDSIFNLAIEAIDKGIEAFPDRLDFRFAKAAACRFVYDMQKLYQTVEGILEQSRINDCLWRWTGDEALDSEASLDLMLEGINNFETDLAENFDFYELLALNLKYYNDDPIALAIKGLLKYNSGNKEEAKKFLQCAYEIAPDNLYVVFNFADICLNLGEKDKAYSLYSSVLENEQADEDSKGAARQMIEYMDADTKSIDLYLFEYQYIPMIAKGVVPCETGLEILCNVDYITGPCLANFGYSFPEDQKDIKIDVIGKGEDAVAVWTMPEPKIIPLARYIAFVPDLQANNYMVYTLEKSIDWDGEGQTWVLGLTCQDGHSNFGGVPYAETPDDFVNIVMRIINSNK